VSVELSLTVVLDFRFLFFKRLSLFKFKFSCWKAECSYLVEYCKSLFGSAVCYFNFSWHFFVFIKHANHMQLVII